MPEYTPSYVGGSLIKGAVKNIKACSQCGGLPEFGQHSRDAMSQSYIKCQCGNKVEDNIPINQLVSFWEAKNR